MKANPAVISMLIQLRRMGLKIGFDAALAFASVWIAFLLQYEFKLPPQSYVTEHALTFAAFFTCVSLALGLPRAIWRFTAISDLIKVAEVIAISLTLFIIYQFIFRRELFAMPSLMGIHALVFGSMICGQRLLHRAWHEGLFRPLVVNNQKRARTRILIIGGGKKTDQFIKQTMGNPFSPYEIIGLLDDTNRSTGETLHGIKIMGNLARLTNVLENLANTQAAPQRLVFASHNDMQRIAPEKLTSLMDTYGFQISQLPDTTRLQDVADADSTSLKSIAIEDLLGRPQAHIDLSALQHLIAGRSILVTGAGGSIGGELSRQIGNLKPASLTLLDASEFNLYSIEQDLLPIAKTHAVQLHPYLADVRDVQTLNRIFNAERPDIVFHAAALKHVPLVELNVSEGVRTNILGTANVAAETLKIGALAFVQISSDKAVNPTNIMGASKRFGEYLAQAQDLTGCKTRFITVRFGNVLGSSGSVVPLFRKQLEMGGPLTITHPDIKRYFMTVHEAVSLVLQASSTALNDPNSRGIIHVLDMGAPIKIIDIARQMIRLADLRPDIDIKIETVGLRPGEKLFEELFDTFETQMATSDPAILAATTKALPLETLEAALQDIATAASINDESQIRSIFEALIPGYKVTP